MQTPGVSTSTSGGISDKITVGLQDMYSYLLWPIIILVIIALIPPIIMLVKHIRNKNKIVTEDYVAPVKALDINSAKQKYTGLIASIVEKYNSGKLSDKHAYQQLSKVVRSFVFDATGIKVQNYTLSEIKTLNIPKLYYLVDECYEPEFSEDNKGNIVETCEKARQVIVEWN